MRCCYAESKTLRSERRRSLSRSIADMRFLWLTSRNQVRAPTFLNMPFWHWRIEKNTLPQNIQPNFENQGTPSQNQGHFNNSMYNSDITSLKNLLLLISLIFFFWLIHGLSLSLIDKNETSHVALRFFITFRISSIFFVVICPLVLIVTKREAKQHIRFLFWNEWAPEFIQVYNPNRVHVIELNQCPKV